MTIVIVVLVALNTIGEVGAVGTEAACIVVMGLKSDQPIMFCERYRNL